MNNRMVLPLQMECVMLFQADPQFNHSIEDLASSLGETTESLEPVVALLVKQGIIEQLQETEKIVYRYQEPDMASEFEISP